MPSISKAKQALYELKDKTKNVSFIQLPLSRNFLQKRISSPLSRVEDIDITYIEANFQHPSEREEFEVWLAEARGEHNTITE